MAIRVPFDSLTLRAVADDLKRALVGGAVQHVAQPAPFDLVVTVRNRGANHALLLSCDPTHARAYLTTARRPNPPSPPAFCMLCRKHIEGARVVSAAQRGFDRILDLELDASAGGAFRLVAELMGKHSNLIFLDQNGIVLDAAKRITRKLSRFREVLPGRPYLPPPSQDDKNDPFSASPEEIADLAADWPSDREAQAARLMAHYEGISPFLAAETALRAERLSLPQAWEEVFGAAESGRWSPVLIRNERAEPVGAYPLASEQFPAADQHHRESISIALDHYYGIALPRAALDAARHELQTALERAIRAREKQRESLARSLQESGRAEEFKHTGELLLANLHRIEDEAGSITVTDYYQPDAPECTIALDPSLSGRENAEAYFRRYRKARDGAEMQRAQLERTEGDLDELRAAQDRLAEATDVAAISALRAELTERHVLRPESGGEERKGPQRREPAFGGKKIRVFHTPEGWDIYVGENSEANDYLTVRVAAPNDLWLHVRATTSAHVVIKTRNAPGAVPPSVLKQAALLAARHSAAKHSSTVPVDYTLRKHVRRPRGAAPGTVLYQHEKTLYVSPKE